MTADQRRVLQLLAGDHYGATAALMLARGFRREMLAGLAQAGLVTVATDTMRAGATPIKVKRYRITDDGRDALALHWATMSGATLAGRRSPRNS
jgi:hypothetical protein